MQCLRIALKILPLLMKYIPEYLCPLFSIEKKEAWITFCTKQVLIKRMKIETATLYKSRKDAGKTNAVSGVFYLMQLIGNSFS